MKPKHFLKHVEHDRILRAIHAAEQGTSGDIVLYITHQHIDDALLAANAEFQRLKLDAATVRNSLLIFVAPESQTFAVVGGPALHDKVGQTWWNELVALLRAHFNAGDFTGGLIAAINRAGDAMRKHFPAQSVDRTGQHDIIEE